MICHTLSSLNKEKDVSDAYREIKKERMHLFKVKYYKKKAKGFF
jgi:hypothetical protein